MKSKSTEKTKIKTHSNDEVKRYIGVVSENFQHGLSAIGEQFGGLNKKLDEHTKILDSHTKILDGHSKTLDSHTKMIGSIMMDMSVAKEDIEIIKNDLKQKVDRNEFEALTRRVSVVERKVMR